jgi:hypothetical protein
MFEDVLKNEFENRVIKNKQQKAKLVQTNETKVDEPLEKKELDLVRYKSMLQDSQATYQREVDEMVSSALYAADKFFRIQKQIKKEGRKVHPQQAIDPNNQIARKTSKRYKSQPRHLTQQTPRTNEETRVQAMQTFMV